MYLLELCCLLPQTFYDALQGDMDEILALTTSQTETMLEEINSYETQPSQEKNDRS
jgi:hypothetical protein